MTVFKALFEVLGEDTKEVTGMSFPLLISPSVESKTIPQLKAKFEATLIKY